MPISTLSYSNVDAFYPVYNLVLKTEFPGYKPGVIDFLLNRMYNVSNLRMWIQSGDKIILIAKDSEKIVGFAMIDALYGGVSFCRWLGVLPDYQHNGIGTQLILEWKKMAIHQGAHKMEVAGQPSAKEFYVKMGLDLEGFRKASYFGIDQHLFGKVLGSPDVRVMVR
jgi:ribosomal protein S18 acetylase RimI-like enzyme